MARRSTRQRMRAPKRVVSIPNARPRRLRQSLPRLDLRAFEDRRLFVPDPLPRYRSLLNPWPNRIRAMVTSPARVAEAPRGHLRSAMSQLGMRFEAPKKVLVCVRRKQRREVLHALKRTRKGAGSAKRRNQWSDVKC